MPSEIRIESGFRLIAPPSLWPRNYFRPIPIEARAADYDPVAAIMQTHNGVAVIGIRGIMAKDAYWHDDTSTPVILQAVQKAVESKRVKAIMLSIDTPGGSVEGLDRLADAVYGARQIKPVVSQVDDGMAASAGYYVASQANKIFLGRGDMVGSIGTIMTVDDYSAYFEKEGVKVHLITTGEYKGAGVAGVPVTEKQIDDFQRIVDTYFGMFKDVVKRGRGMNDEKLDALADGRMFIGQDAVDKGLADGIQTADQTLLDLVVMAKAMTDTDMRMQEQEASRLRLLAASE